MNARLYILNLNLFQELNHYNNIAGRIWILFLSIYYNIVCCLDFFYKKKK